MARKDSFGMKITLIFLFSIVTFNAFSQALPIFLDGTFSDWENAVFTYVDEVDDGQDVDFVKFTVANDAQFLFIKVLFTSEIDLFDYNDIVLHIDADNNPATGYSVNGIGSEMDWNFGQKYGYFSYGGSWRYIDFADIQLRALPSVTSNCFEIAIGRIIGCP